MIKKASLHLIVGLILMLFVSSAFAADLTLQDLLTQIQSNQFKITDMYAETTTTITSNIAMLGAKKKGPQKTVQKAKMWTKGKDKSKIEMISPMKQITITNGDQMAIINTETGQKMIRDLNKTGPASLASRRSPLGEAEGSGPAGGQMSLEKAKEYFDLSVQTAEDSEQKKTNYIIIGIPKKENKFLGRMEFYVDGERWVPVKILMYMPSVASAKEDGAKDKLMSQSEIEYKSFEIGAGDEKDIVWIPVKNISNVNTPVGKMKVEMVYEKIEVNKGIKDKVFEID